MAGVVLFDTDVLIDAARGVVTALDVLEDAAREHALAISIITQMELIVGCRNKAELRAADKFLQRFSVLLPGEAAYDQAVGLLHQYRLSHGLQIPDAVIAATALTEGVPLVSKNQRDYRFIPDLQLLPYPPTFR
ncbi:MAG TPA: type II toxin-antitoxin system VapC family toxin [Longimicrobium sp.]